MYNIENPEDDLVRKTDTEFITNIMKISTKDESNKFCMMPKSFIDRDLERIKKFEVYEDDVWVVTFPKCGTTWTQEMIWMLSSNLDYETDKKVTLDDRFPFLEMGGIAIKLQVDIVEKVKNMPRPRHIKSHLPLFLLPDQLWIVKPKIIYVVRNPKDTAVSYFHHHCHLHVYTGTKEDYIQAFLKDLVLYSPMNDHVLEFWKIRNEPNILFLFFEDMKRNLEQEVKKAMTFLGKNFNQEQIDKLCQHLSFESIQKNDMVNKSEVLTMLRAMRGKTDELKEFTFIRKGQVGGYKKELTAEEIESLDNYAKHPELEENGFEYKY